MGDILPISEPAGELVCCPFCGGDKIGKRSKPGRHPARIGAQALLYFVCNECGCRGPTALTRDAAKEAWNRRL